MPSEFLHRLFVRARAILRNRGFLRRRRKSAPRREFHISSIDEIKQRLEEIPEDMRPIDQLLRVAGLLVLAMEGQGLRPIVVGGAAVAIYTERSMSTGDIDFVVQGARYAAIDCLKALGFVRGLSAGVWWYSRLNIPVEVPSAQLEGDPSRVREIDIGDGLKAFVIGIEDLILDRTEQACAQDSPSSDVRYQAILLLASYWEQLDWDYLRTESDRRDIRSYFEKLVEKARKAR